MADEQIEMLLAKLAESEVGSEQKEVREAITSFLARKKERATPQKLIQMLTLLNKDHVFQKGQLVRWKKGLKDRRIPREDEPAIVVRVLDEVIFDEQKESGSPYFKDPLDVVLGVIHEGQFLMYHYNSHKFEPYE
jgi:hypothetical protein